MATTVQPLSGDGDTSAAASKLPLKPIPGSYGIKYIQPIKDRLDYFYNQGEEAFFTTRVAKYGSTVFRVNMPPGPFIASDPRVVALLDAKSFPVLFDTAKVEKRDVFTGTYMPSTSLTGGYRVCSYLDPTEPKHTAVKQLLFNLLASRKANVIPSFRAAYTTLFDTVESQLPSSDFNAINDSTGLAFLGDAFFGVAPPADAPAKATKWLALQLHPLVTVGLPRVIEELLLHTFPLPPIIAKSAYRDLYAYFDSAAGGFLEGAAELGLTREEACHNVAFATLFNSYGGVKVLLPRLLSRVAAAGGEVHARLATEVRGAAAKGGVTVAAVAEMELVGSAVYESLRLDPPVKFQYGRARRDLLVESHEAAFEVKAGEMLFGYQPLATRDGVVFEDAGEYVVDRFVGEKGRALLKYVVWSNGPETEGPTVANKQCAGKDFVVLVAKLFVAELFLRYDTFTADIGADALGVKVTFTSVTKAKV